HPFPHSLKNMDEELSLKKDLLMKYNAAINMKDSYEKKLNELRGSYNSIENKLFQSKTENLAQAKLQGYVKDVARQSGLIISRSSAQKGEVISDSLHLMLVYVRVEIADIDRITKLQKFLYNIEYDKKKFLFVDDLKIKGVGFDTTKGVSTIIKLFALAKLEAKT
ncbi:MAG: GspMb/PilO family protein, partial [Thermodesulfobacteriota bacterium]